jgi:predicted alpha/beta-hydrolase family hydrolase
MARPRIRSALLNAETQQFDPIDKCAGMRPMLKIRVGDQDVVSAILQVPKMPTACYIMAHGAGAGMTHPFMAAVADGLAERRVATLRYQFPFMEKESTRPDRAPIAQAAVRAAVEAAAGLVPCLPLFAGGKSFGGRMTSQTQAEKPLPGVRGLIFFGFPLHPAKKPSVQRADHLAALQVPTLFLQGDRDALADLALMKPLVKKLGPLAALKVIEDADHAFHVRKLSGRTDAQALAAMLDEVATWIGQQ